MFSVKLYGCTHADEKIFALQLAETLGIDEKRAEELIGQCPCVVAEYEEEHQCQDLVRRLVCIGALCLSGPNGDNEIPLPPESRQPHSADPMSAGGISEWLRSRIVLFACTSLMCVAVVYFSFAFISSMGKINRQMSAPTMRPEPANVAHSEKQDDSRELDQVEAELRVAEDRAEDLARKSRESEENLQALLTTPGSDPNRIKQQRSRVSVSRSEVSAARSEVERLKAMLNRLETASPE